MYLDEKINFDSAYLIMKERVRPFTHAFNICLNTPVGQLKTLAVFKHSGCDESHQSFHRFHFHVSHRSSDWFHSAQDSSLHRPLCSWMLRDESLFFKSHIRSSQAGHHRHLRSAPFVRYENTDL